MSARIVLRLYPELGQRVPLPPALGQPSERSAAGDQPVTQRPDVEMGIDVDRGDRAAGRAQERRMAGVRPVVTASEQHHASARRKGR